MVVEANSIVQLIFWDLNYDGFLRLVQYNIYGFKGGMELLVNKWGQSGRGRVEFCLKKWGEQECCVSVVFSRFHHLMCF